MTPFSFLQLQAFVTVAQAKSYSRAAIQLKKDRKTISELVENFEINVGYPLFQKDGRTMSLTPLGYKLYLRAQILSADIFGFERYAHSLSEASKCPVSLCFDESIPERWLTLTRNFFSEKNIPLNLLKVSREQGEKLLRNGQCQYGLFLARGQVLNPEFQWKAMPQIALCPVASESTFCFDKYASIKELSQIKQRVYSSNLEPKYYSNLLVSDNYVIESDLQILIHGLQSEPSWAFLPVSLLTALPDEIDVVAVDITTAGLYQQPVLLWASTEPPFLNEVIALLKSVEC